MRFLVVGRGIAGSSFARHAIERGHEVAVVADPDRNTASLAALCVVRADWFKGAQHGEAEWSIDWYRRNGWVTTERMRWRTYRNGVERERDGFVAIDPLGPLVTAAVCPLRRGEWVADDSATGIVRWRDNGPEGFGGPLDAIVLCRGSYSDLDWPRRWGATCVWHDGEASDMAAYEDRPRNALYTVTHDDGQQRFGSSIAKDAPEAVNRQINDVIKANTLGLVPPANEISVTVTGVRLMPPKGVEPGLVRRLSRVLWAVEGFGRVGFSLAPARTYNLLRAIEQETQ